MPMYYFTNFALGLPAYFFAFQTKQFKQTFHAVWFSLSVLDSIFPIGMILPGDYSKLVNSNFLLRNDSVSL